MIKQKRLESSNVLVLDAGNSLIGDQGTAVSTQGQSSVEAMNMMGYDAMALGEDDWVKLGLDVLRKRAQEAGFPVLSANLVLSPTGELVFAPYTIREFGDHRVAIIGLTGPITTAQVRILDPVDAVRQVVSELKDQADVIVLLSHAGLNVNRQIADAIPEVDLVISGGGQSSVSSPALTTDGRTIVHADVPSPGHAGRQIGVGTWIFDAQGHPVGHVWQRLALGPEIADDPPMQSWVQTHP